MRSKVLYGLILLILCGSFSKSRAQGTEEVSSKGTDFWIASTYPFYSNDSFLIAVSSSKPTRAYMSIPGFNIYDSLELGYNEIKYFVVPSSIRRSYYYYRQNGGGSLNNKIGENAIHITSILPIRVFSFSTGTYYSSGATAVYPSTSQPLDGKYYPYKSRYQWTGGLQRYRIYFFSVVAIDDSVTVKLNINKSIQLWNRPPGDTVRLKKGQMVRFYMWAFNINDEPKLSAQATGGKRIAVFSENFYDFEDNNCRSFDLMYEQMMPENLLGKEFILTPIAFLKKGYRFSVSAVTDSTHIYKNGVLIATLNKADQFYSKVGKDSSVIISSDKPITCWEKIDLDTCASGSWWNNGGISLFTVNSNEQLVEDANILIPTGADYPSNFINIIVPKIAKDSLYVDGQLMLAGQLKPIINGDYFFFQDSARQGTIRVINKYGFLAYAYGRGRYGGYAYNASSGLNSLKRVIEAKTYSSCDSGFLIAVKSTGVSATDFSWTWKDLYKDTGLSTFFYSNIPGIFPLELKYKLEGSNKYDSVEIDVIIKSNGAYDFIPKKEVKICKKEHKVELPYAAILSYLWSDGDTNRVKVFKTDGNFGLKISNRQTDCKIYDTINVRFFDTIKAKVKMTLENQCPGIPIYLENKSIYGSKDSIINYQWYVDGQKTGTKKNDTVPYAYPGDYVFKLVIENKAGCVDSTFQTTYISDIPTLVAGTKVLDSCVGTSNIRFNSQSRLSEGKIVAYRWIFSDGDTTHDWRQTVRNFKIAGTISYQFAAYTEQGCADTTPVQTVKIYKGPSPSFTIPDSIACLNGNYFDIVNTTKNKTNGKRYVWFWGNGAGSAEMDPGSVSYFDTGKYIIRMVGVDSATICGGDTMDRMVRVLNTPLAKIFVDSFNYCSNRNYYQLTDNSKTEAGLKKQTFWSWSDGTRDTSSGSLLKSFDTAGSYALWMTHSIGKGCTDSVRKSLVVFQSPTAGMEISDSSVCQPNEFINIKNNSKLNGFAQYYWGVKNEKTSSIDLGRVTKLDTGLNRISLIVHEPLYDCADTAYRFVRIYANPNVKIHTLDSEMCFPKRPFIFKDSTGFNLDNEVHRYWQIGSDSSQRFPYTFIPQKSGKTEVKLIYSLKNTCWDTAVAHVNVLHETDSLNLRSNWYKTCIPASFSFSVNPSTGTPWEYNWSSENTNTLGGKNYTKTYFSTGSKKMNVTATTGKCIIQDSIRIEALNKPELSIIAKTNLQHCFKQQKFDIEASLRLATEPVTYEWLVPQNNFTNQTNINPVFADKGSYQIMLQIKDSNNCADTAIEFLTVLESPTIVLDRDSACIGTKKNISFNINPIGFEVKNYTWLIDGSIANQSNLFEYEYLNTNSKTVQLLIEGDNSCKDTSNISRLKGLEKPKANFSAIILNSNSSGVPVQFTNESSGEDRYEWIFQKGAISMEENPRYTYTELGKKQAILKVWNSQGCFDTAQIQLFVTSDQLAFIPTAFSPNKFGPNELFKPAELSAVKSYSIKVFNRWGQIIYTSTNPNEGWDGTYMGTDAPEGVYGYQIFAQFITGVGFLHNGNVHLLR
ncbi:gliding motility-associated C-terminal domain-containing protein [Bacteroidia bacterium]|nr:gliding motility-associated C-terminal domain-containing protein [Bacteroidia bacterium]